MMISLGCGACRAAFVLSDQFFAKCNRESRCNEGERNKTRRQKVRNLLTSLRFACELCQSRLWTGGRIIHNVILFPFLVREVAG